MWHLASFFPHSILGPSMAYAFLKRLRYEPNKKLMVYRWYKKLLLCLIISYIFWINITTGIIYTFHSWPFAQFDCIQKKMLVAILWNVWKAQFKHIQCLTGSARGQGIVLVVFYYEMVKRMTQSKTYFAPLQFEINLIFISV